MNQLGYSVLENLFYQFVELLFKKGIEKGKHKMIPILFQYYTNISTLSIIIIQYNTIFHLYIHHYFFCIL